MLEHTEERGGHRGTDRLNRLVTAGETPNGLVIVGQWTGDLTVGAEDAKAQMLNYAE